LVLSRVERSLTPRERNELLLRLDAARREASRALLKSGAASAAVCGALGLLTAALSDAPLVVVTAFWFAMTVLFTVWIGWPWRKLMRQQIPLFEAALRRDRAVETRVQAKRVVEFEEVEDEGACYAFEHHPGASLFVVGQEFYEDNDFPNTDFSMVDILGEGPVPVTTLMIKSGSKLVPERVVPSAVKNTLELPDHLTLIDAPLERIEAALPERQ
jgi:hypothetical protein